MAQECKVQPLSQVLQMQPAWARMYSAQLLLLSTHPASDEGDVNADSYSTQEVSDDNVMWALTMQVHHAW